MNFTWIIVILAALGLGMGLLMKFSSKTQQAFRLNDPAVDKKYMNYKTNFLITVSAAIIVIQGISLFKPLLSDKLDMAMAAFLLLAITVDTITKRKMRSRNK